MAGKPLVAEAGPNALASFTLNWDLHHIFIVTVPTGLGSDLLGHSRGRLLLCL